MRIVPGGAVVVALVLTAAAAHAERPRIAVTPLDGAAASAVVRERMTRSMSEGLAASGATIVPVTSATPPSDVDYVFRGSLDVAGRTYDWRIEMLDGKSGALLQLRTDRCEICTEDEALEMAGVSASTLKAHVSKANEPAQVRVDLGHASAPTAAGLVSVPLEPARSHRSLGWVGVGAGVVAAAAGVYLLSIDGQGTCSGGMVQCERVRDTKVGGWVSIAGGAAALTLGVLLLSGTF